MTTITIAERLETELSKMGAAIVEFADLSLLPFMLLILHLHQQIENPQLKTIRYCPQSFAQIKCTPALQGV